MCIIVWKPKGKTVPEEYLKKCYESNRDGCGLMFSTGEELKLFKGLFSFPEFMELYRRHEREALLMHFRVRTHGLRSKENSHPFIINDTLGFAHNGVITGVGTSNSYSDTYLFNEQVLKLLPKNWEEHPQIMELINKFVGKSNKLAILRVDGKILIVNESSGVWENGVWYSHGGYKDFRNYSHTEVRNTNTRRESRYEEDPLVGKDVCRLCFQTRGNRSNTPEKELGLCYSCASKFSCPECLQLMTEGQKVFPYEVTQSIVSLEAGECKTQSKHKLGKIVDLLYMDLP